MCKRSERTANSSSSTLPTIANLLFHDAFLGASERGSNASSAIITPPSSPTNIEQIEAIPIASDLADQRNRLFIENRPPSPDSDSERVNEARSAFHVPQIEVVSSDSNCVDSQSEASSSKFEPEKLTQKTLEDNRIGQNSVSRPPQTQINVIDSNNEVQIKVKIEEEPKKSTQKMSSSNNTNDAQSPLRPITSQLVGAHKNSEIIPGAQPQAKPLANVQVSEPPSLQQRLLSAAQRGDLRILRQILSTEDGRALLTGGADIWSEVRDSLNLKNGDSPLHRACRFGAIEAIRLLVGDFSAPLDLVNKRGEQPLFVAIDKGHQRAVSILLQLRPTLLESKDKDDNTPLNFAAIRGKFDLVRYFVTEKKANLENEGRHGMTALIQAASYGHAQIVSFLLENGANAFAKSNEIAQCQMAIHRACCLGHQEIVRILLSKEPLLLEARDNEDNTPLNFAAMCGNFDLVRYLVTEKNANLENRGGQGMTPLIMAANEGHASVVDFFLENGANGYAKADRTCYKQMAIHRAALNSHVEVVDCLLSNDENFLTAKDELSNTPLILAIENGKLEMVQFLLAQKKVNIERRDSIGYTALLHAVNPANNKCSAPITECLLANGADVEARVTGSVNAGEDEWTALHLAANVDDQKVVAGNLRIVASLLEKEPKLIEAKDANNATPLHIAAAANNLAVVKHLVQEFGADMEQRGRHGRTALLEAAFKGNLPIVQWLVENGAKIDERTDDATHRKTAIHLAAEFGFIEIVAFLLEKRPDFLEMKDSQGETPLNRAAACNKLAVVRYLVERKASLENRGSKGRTPLLDAARQGHLAIVKFLVSCGADVDATLMSDDGKKKTGDSKTALHLAISSGHLDVVKYLLEKRPSLLEAKTIIQETPVNETALNRAAACGQLEIVKYLVSEKQANLENRAANDMTPLLYAAAFGHVEVVEWLVENGANVDATTDADTCERTAIHLAAGRGFLDVVRCLLDEKPPLLEAKDKVNETPLNRASACGHLDIVRYLVVEKRAYIENRGFNGGTPLLHAARMGHVRVVECLLAFGANIDAEDAYGWKAVHLAAYNGHSSIVDYLLSITSATGDETPRFFSQLKHKTDVVALMQ